MRVNRWSTSCWRIYLLLRCSMDFCMEKWKGCCYTCEMYLKRDDVMSGEDRGRLMFFFFFRQKTAYEVLRSLVGSEMCIRDSNRTPAGQSADRTLRRNETAGRRTRPGSRSGRPSPPNCDLGYETSRRRCPRWRRRLACHRSTTTMRLRACLLYTSDAADDLPCVDLGGRRIIKQKHISQ